MKKPLPPAPSVIADGEKLLEEFLLSQSTYPKEGWYAINQHWDIHLFTEDDQRKATLYPVINGETSMKHPHPLTANLAAG